MKKLFVWAATAVLLTGTALAQFEDRFFIQPNATFAAGSPATTNNDDSCDIGVVPAATLLLPVFEVDIVNPANVGVNTVFTLTNVTDLPTIAHIVVWTDWSFPVLDFNIWLTGYDVQGLSLRDILGRPGTAATIPPTTAIAGGPSPRGSLSALNTANPNHAGDAITSCTSLPGQIPETLAAAIRSALTTGIYVFSGGGCPPPPGAGPDARQVGSAHPNAIGYITVDVANRCSQSLGVDEFYYTSEILFDNVLIGDYQRISPTAAASFAGGSPLVHIRAIPEGGPAGAVTATNLPFTYYDRYTPRPPGNPKVDRRQPLPGTFAARVLTSTSAAPVPFGTRLAIWREGYENSAGTIGECGLATTITAQLTNNSNIFVPEIVRFDEFENPTTLAPGGGGVSPALPGEGLNEASLQPIGNARVFPQQATPASGWLFLNLNHQNVLPTGAPPGSGNDYSAPRQAGGSHAGRSQNWVIVQLSADADRFAVDFDAAWLGNGCSANTTQGQRPIRPSPNTTP